MKFAALALSALAFATANAKKTSLRGGGYSSEELAQEARVTAEALRVWKVLHFPQVGGGGGGRGRAGGTGGHLPKVNGEREARLIVEAAPGEILREGAGGLETEGATLLLDYDRWRTSSGLLAPMHSRRAGLPAAPSSADRPPLWSGQARPPFSSPRPHDRPPPSGRGGAMASSAGLRAGLGGVVGGPGVAPPGP
ncbi:hypothetical protein THAOC_31474, partial [Thalassiosira oceanica]